MKVVPTATQAIQEETTMQVTELTKQEQQLILEMITNVVFPSGEAKLLAGNLQLKIEASLAESQT